MHESRGGLCEVASSAKQSVGHRRTDQYGTTEHDHIRSPRLVRDRFSSRFLHIQRKLTQKFNIETSGGITVRCGTRKLRLPFSAMFVGRTEPNRFALKNTLKRNQDKGISHLPPDLYKYLSVWSIPQSLPDHQLPAGLRYLYLQPMLERD